MKTDVLNKRVSALEGRSRADLADDESKKTRAFLEKLTIDELRRLCEITERSEAGSFPTPEEQSFLDDLEARYGAF